MTLLPLARSLLNTDKTSLVKFLLSELRAYFIQRNDRSAYDRLIDIEYTHTGEEVISAFCEIAACVVKLEYKENQYEFVPQKTLPKRIVELKLSRDYTFSTHWPFERIDRIKDVFHCIFPLDNEKNQQLLDFHMESYALTEDQRAQYILEIDNNLLKQAIVRQLQKETFRGHDVACLTYILQAAGNVSECVSLQALEEVLKDTPTTDTIEETRYHAYCTSRFNVHKKLLKYTEILPLKESQTSSI